MSDDFQLFVMDIKRPSSTIDDLGRRTGAETTIASGVFVYLKQVRGRELEVARQNYPDTTHRARWHSDPAWAVAAEDYFQDADTGEKFYLIQPPLDQYRTGLELDAYVMQAG